MCFALKLFSISLPSNCVNSSSMGSANANGVGKLIFQITRSGTYFE